jgi:MFS family permease
VRAAASGTFRSLHNRNYRLFFGGQLISTVGTWMQTVALAWLVLKMTNSPAQVGFIIAVQFVPTFIGGIHGGLVADRFDKRKVLLTTQTLFTLQAIALSAFAIAHAATLPVLYVLALVQGAITTIDNPARQAFVAEMVPADEVPNAVGLNSAMFNTARILGPAIGGLLIDLVGTTTCFMLNAVSFLAVIVGLAVMRPQEFFRGAPVPRQKGALREGLRYTWNDPTLRLVMLMVALIGTLAMNFSVVLPVLAKQVFHGSAGTFGMLSAVLGVGSLIGALAAASRGAPTVRVLTIADGARPDHRRGRFRRGDGVRRRRPRAGPRSAVAHPDGRGQRLVLRQCQRHPPAHEPPRAARPGAGDLRVPVPRLHADRRPRRGMDQRPVERAVGACGRRRGVPDRGRPRRARGARRPPAREAPQRAGLGLSVVTRQS